MHYIQTIFYSAIAEEAKVIIMMLVFLFQSITFLLSDLYSKAVGADKRE